MDVGYETEQKDEKKDLQTGIKIFGRWSMDTLTIKDKTLRDQMDLTPKWLPHTLGRYQKKRFRKLRCPIVERFINCLMMHGRNSGKKLLALNMMRQVLEIIEVVDPFSGEEDPEIRKKFSNPVQVLIQALELGGPREDSTRVGSAGVVRRQAVDVSPLRRINQAMALIISGARRSAFRNVKSMAECLADEIILCALNSPNSYAIKKKTEIERVAASNR